MIFMFDIYIILMYNINGGGFMKMKRTQIYIPQCDMDKLKDIAEEQQIAISEIIRRLISAYLNKEGLHDRSKT